MERLNQYASKFLFHVKEIPETEEHRRKKGSTEHLPVVDWSDNVVSDPIISKELNYDNSIVKIYKTIEGKRFGFDDAIYPHLIKFTSLLSSLPLFKDQTSERFILDETFNWVIDSFKANRIQLQLFTYLQNRIEQETEIRTYHFPVMNLHIEEPFQIGNTKFQYFTKQYFDDYYNEIENPKTSKEEFEKLFRKYYGRVVISCKAKAEPIKSEEIAFTEASLAMDVFRLFSPAIFNPTVIFKVDLEKRININFSSDHLTEIQKDGENILLTFDANNDPFYFDKKIYNLVIQGGLMNFSDFIKAPKKDDLYKLILQSISFYSFSLSIQDFHLRISQLIMIVEGLLLEEDWVKEMEKKAKKRLCKLMFHQNSKELITLNSVMTSMYKVRHQMTHKGNRIPIPINNFRYLQILLVEFLKKLIVLNQSLKNKTELITYIDALS